MDRFHRTHILIRGNVFYNSMNINEVETFCRCSCHFLEIYEHRSCSLVSLICFNLRESIDVFRLPLFVIWTSNEIWTVWLFDDVYLNMFFPLFGFFSCSSAFMGIFEFQSWFACWMYSCLESTELRCRLWFALTSALQWSDIYIKGNDHDSQIYISISFQEQPLLRSSPPFHFSRFPSFLSCVCVFILVFM